MKYYYCRSQVKIRMSESTIKMSDFIVQRKNDHFFSMPQESLITLSGHIPVMKTILHYLPMTAKKNLRLTHPRKLKDIIVNDETWIWTVNLGEEIEFPSYFFDSTIPVVVIFPKNESNDFISNPEKYDLMITLIEKIKK